MLGNAVSRAYPIFLDTVHMPVPGSLSRTPLRIQGPKLVFAFRQFQEGPRATGSFHGAWPRTYVGLGISVPYSVVLRLVFSLSFFFDACISRNIEHCSVSPVHYSQDPQVLYSEKNFKMGLTALFTHLKIILLQCFQFLAKKTVSKQTLSVPSCSLHLNM